MIVQVDEILEAAEDFKHLQGQKITVEAVDINNYAVNDSKVFFADRWVFGESVAVRNLGDFKASNQPQSSAKLKEKIKDLNGAKEAKEVRSMVSKANVIFSGKVTELNQVKSLNSGLLTEHNPEWMEAKIEVTEPMKGMGRNQSEMTIVFSNSIDVMWFQAPKFKVDDTGVWLLSKREAEVAKSPRRQNLFIVSDPAEFTNDPSLIDQIKKNLK